MLTQICESARGFTITLLYLQAACKGGFECFTALWREPESSWDAEGFVLFCFFKSQLIFKTGKVSG